MINKNLFRPFFLIVTIVFAAGCNKSKDSEITLPAYESKLVVECYLQPGKPYRLLLTESVSYFDPPAVPQVSDALITITFKGRTDTLKYIPFYRDETDTTKFYNFANPSILVDTTYNVPYSIYIKDAKGRVITGTTQLLPPVAPDTIEYINTNTEDTLGYIFSRIKINPLQNEYYRCILFKEDSSGRSVSQNIFFDQALTSTNQALVKTDEAIILKSGNDFSKNPKYKDKHLYQLFHIEAAYYNFLKSVRDSQDANGNPFAQPPSIKSNVQGGVGIFTGLSVFQEELISPP